LSHDMMETQSHSQAADRIWQVWWVAGEAGRRFMTDHKLVKLNVSFWVESNWETIERPIFWDWIELLRSKFALSFSCVIFWDFY
jgi:hypothetical protein